MQKIAFRKMTLTCVLALLLSIFVCHSAYSFDICYKSEISPVVFSQWKVIESFKVDKNRTTVRVQNPDQFARIKEVSIETFDSIPIAYCYWIDSTIYRYEFNFDTRCYEESIVLKFEDGPGFYELLKNWGK